MYSNELDHRFVQTAIFVILRVMRRRNMLNAADLTELRVAFDHKQMPENLANKMQRLLAETILDREEKRETPRKPG